MSDSQKYEERLGGMLEEITKELQSIGIHNPSAKEDWIAVPGDHDEAEPDPNDAADSVEDWNERRAIVSALEPRYNNIVHALERIKEGTYGKCSVCGNDIEEARLEANPAAPTCAVHMEEQN